MRILFVLLIFCFGCGVRSANILVNSSAEILPFDSIPFGWENISGNWTSQQGDSLHHDYGYAENGKRFFFGGNGSLCILQQTVNVSSYAGEIDKGSLRFILNGFEQSLDQGPLSDQGKLKMECLDAAKNHILSIDSTDTLMSIGKWKAVADTLMAPRLTRFVRISLIAIRHVGGDNDGYFDDITLSAASPPQFTLIAIIVVGILAIAGGTWLKIRSSGWWKRSADA
jgi:hypothetical protein